MRRRPTLPRLANLLIAPRAQLLRVDHRPAEQGRAEQGRALIAVDGLVCGLCAARVRVALEATPGVASATCDLRSQRATVAFDPTRLDPRTLPARVEAAAILLPLRRLLARLRPPLRGRAHAG